MINFLIRFTPANSSHIMQKNQPNSSTSVSYRLVTTQKYYPSEIIKTAYLNSPKKSRVVAAHKSFALSKVERPIDIVSLIAIRAVEMDTWFGEVMGSTFPWFEKSMIQNKSTICAIPSCGYLPAYLW